MRFVFGPLVSNTDTSLCDQTRDLRQAVEEFNEHGTFSETLPTKPPKTTRLCGPHYILELAIAPPEQDLHRNRSGTDILIRQKVQTQDDVPITSGDMSNEEKPDIPAWLSQARGHQNLPLTPSISQPPFPQPCNTSKSYAPLQPLATQNVMGSSASGSTWPGGLSLYPSIPTTYPSPCIPLIYGRAKGNETAAMAPLLPERDSNPTRPLLETSTGYYERAGGKTLPFPCINNAFLHRPAPTQVSFTNNL